MASPGRFGDPLFYDVEQVATVERVSHSDGPHMVYPFPPASRSVSLSGNISDAVSDLDDGNANVELVELAALYYMGFEVQDMTMDLSISIWPEQCTSSPKKNR